MRETGTNCVCISVLVMPNVRAKRATTAGRQARTGEKCTAYHRTGPGGLPLTLRLSEGLGITEVTSLNGFGWVLKDRHRGQHTKKAQLSVEALFARHGIENDFLVVLG